MKMIENAVRYMVELENLLTEHDQWLSTYSLFTLKRDMLRRYGALEGDTELQEHIDELDSKVRMAGEMLEGSQVEIKTKTGLEQIEESRRHLIHLKSALNAYAEKAGEEYAVSMDHLNQTTETLMEEIGGLLTNG